MSLSLPAGRAPAAAGHDSPSQLRIPSMASTTKARPTGAPERDLGREQHRQDQDDEPSLTIEQRGEEEDDRADGDEGYMQRNLANPQGHEERDRQPQGVEPLPSHGGEDGRGHD